MDIFDVSNLTFYIFCRVKRGTVEGDLIEEQTSHYGVFKLRRGITVSNDQETTVSTSTLHVRPDEPFINSTSLIGQGVIVNGVYYQILNITGGDNYDEGMEHYTLTLQERKYQGF